MPNRILREGILTSARVCELTFPAEVFYRRLMSVVDDYGRYYATRTILRSMCFPLQVDKISDADIGKWLTECIERSLVKMYAVGQTQYLELTDFRQQIRAQKSKFPAPSDGNEVKEASPQPTKVHKANGHDLGPRFAQFWSAYPNKKGKGAAEKAWEKIQPDEALAAQIVRAVSTQCAWPEWTKDGGQFIPHPATWLNAKRWEDHRGASTAPLADGKINCRVCNNRVSSHTAYICDPCYNSGKRA